MKKLILLLLIGSLQLCTNAQEFTVYENQLIYDAPTMNRLGIIVDSLNLKFKTCDLSHPYYSIPQGVATHVVVKRNTSKAREAIEQNITLEDFIQQFPHATVRKNINIIKYRYTDYMDNKSISYSQLPTDNERVYISVPDHPASDKNKGWISQQNYSELNAFFIHDLKSTEIPHEYARLIQYVDCMIDTTASIYFEKAKGDDFGFIEENSKAGDFIRWARNFEGMPEHPNFDYDKKLTEEEIKKMNIRFKEYQQAYSDWDKKRLLDLDKRMKNSPDRMKQLTDSYNEALQSGVSSDELEQYIARYISPEGSLQLKRSRKVIGGCSMDTRPRTHAINICILAAQTAQWDIFLRSHLDIMNDNFQRMTDGSWAWEGRETYLKELEMLNIHATDLLLGTCLQTQSVSDNHYSGDIQRIGRALAETSEPDVVEKQMLTMISDTKLDDYNRLLIAYLFDNYNHHLKDVKARATNNTRFKEVVKTLPSHIRTVFQ